MNVYVRELAREFGRRGIGVDVFTRQQNPFTPRRFALGDNARVIHLPAGPLEPINKTDIYYHLDQFAGEMRRLQECEGVTYDVIHAHYWLSGIAGMKLREAWDAPVVQMFHTLARLKNQTTTDPTVLEPELRADGETMLMREVDRIVVATPVEKAQMSWLYGATGNKFETVPCGVDTRLFAPIDKAEARAALGLDDVRNVLLFVGRLDPIKGIETLLRALAETVRHDSLQPDDLQLLVVGGGDVDGDEANSLQVQPPNPEQVKIRALTRELGLSRYVRFLRSQSQPQLPLYYSAADLTVMPSHYESFGMVALESQACGTPVIASRVGGLPYAVQDGVSGILVEDNDWQTMADTIGSLLADPACCAEMGRAAVARAQQFSWGSIADRLLSIYADARAARNPRTQITLPRVRVSR